MSAHSARWLLGIGLSMALIAWLSWSLGNRGDLPLAGARDAESPSERREEHAVAPSVTLENHNTRTDVVIVVKSSDDSALVEPYVHLVTSPVQKAERQGEGRFVFRHLRPGTWDVEVRSRGLRGQDRQVVVPISPAPTMELEVVLSPYARVSGRVLTPDGVAAKGAQVKAHHEGGALLSAAHSGDVRGMFRPIHVGSPVEADGRFLWEFLPADVRVRVAATHPKYGSAVAELTTRAGENDPVTLTLGPGTSLRGRIPDLPRGESAEVLLFGVQGVSSDQQVTVRTEDTGVFVFEGVAPGNRYVTALLVHDDQLTTWHGRATLAEGESHDMGDLRLGTGPDLLLRITAAPPVPAGAKAYLTCTLWPEAREGVPPEALPLVLHLPLDRSVRIRGLPPGGLVGGAMLQGADGFVSGIHKSGKLLVRSTERSSAPLEISIPLRPPQVPLRPIVVTAVPPPGVAASNFVAVAYILRDGRSLIGSYMHRSPGLREWPLTVAADQPREELVGFCLGHGAMSGPVAVRWDEKGRGHVHHDTWQPAAQLACRVRGREGAPLKGVALTIYKSATEDVAEQQPVARIDSDAEGRAGCTLWPGEAYVIRTFEPGFAPRVLRISADQMSAGKTYESDVDLVPVNR
jgi:hypothetical protein